MKFKGFRTKNPEELQNQMQKAQAVLGEKIYPPDVSSPEELDIPSIQKKYKTRYDAYVSALRAERKGEVDTKEIQHAKEWIQALNNLDSYIKDHESKDNPLLREKQFVAFKKIRDFLEQGKRKGYVKLPTGVGKTILFSKITEALDMKTLIASPSIIILDQNAKETEKFTDSEFGKYYHAEKDLDKKVTHITYNSLVNAIRDGKINPEDIPVLILDEAHDALGHERAQAVSKFNGLQLGFTATSEYSKDKKLSNVMEEILRMDVAECIREGLICQTQTIHAYTDTDLSSVSINKGEYDKNQLEKVINTIGRNMAALELYKNKFNGLTAICNCSGVKHAQAVADLFNEQGISAACVTGETPKGDLEGQRGWILQKYSEGEIKVLTNARVLLKGFNEPHCSVTFNLNPTLSLVDAEQRARSGRLDKSNPDKWSYVVDFIDTNTKKPQVLYSEILGSDRVWNLSDTEETKNTNIIKKDRSSFERKPPINLDDFSVDGLKIIVDTHKIMEVTKHNLDSREKWTYETLRTDIIQKEIKSSFQYTREQKENKWPVSETLTRMPEFPKNPDGSNDWDTFLGREKFDFEKFRKYIIVNDIKSSKEYENKQKENKWPSIERLTRMPEFPKNPNGSNDWDRFLGKKKKEKFTYQTFRLDVLSKDIKSSADYAKNAPKNNWPSAEKLRSMPEFPKTPDGSNDWRAFLGLEKKELIYETLRNDILSKGVKSSHEYRQEYKKNNWPLIHILARMPEFPKNPDGSNDWDTFLGREKKKEWTLETLQADVREKGIMSYNNYAKQAPKNEWPSPITIVKYPNFPKTPDGSNDWRAFLGLEKNKNG